MDRRASFLSVLSAWSKRTSISVPLENAKRPVGVGRPTLNAANWAYHPAEATGSAAFHDHRDIGYSPPQADEQPACQPYFGAASGAF
jgi:hypothetical protein